MDGDMKGKMMLTNKEHAIDTALIEKYKDANNELKKEISKLNETINEKESELVELKKMEDNFITVLNNHFQIILDTKKIINLDESNILLYTYPAYATVDTVETIYAYLIDILDKLNISQENLAVVMIQDDCNLEGLNKQDLINRIDNLNDLCIRAISKLESTDNIDDRQLTFIGGNGKKH